MFWSSFYKEEPRLEVSIDDIPLQTETNKKTFDHNGFNVEPLYDYKIKALVLSKKKYTTSKNESKLSRFDLALGWKEMSKKENIDRISISQRHRWYYWNVDSFFISRKQIEHNSSNHHIVHANDQILEALKDIDEEDVVEMSGYLVKITEKNGSPWYWKSSTSRKDTGDGACEVFYVDNISIVN